MSAKEGIQSIIAWKLVILDGFLYFLIPSFSVFVMEFKPYYDAHDWSKLSRHDVLWVTMFAILSGGTALKAFLSNSVANKKQEISTGNTQFMTKP